MFRVGAFVSIALVLSLLSGCSEKTTETEPTGLELGFLNCVSFKAKVFIDNNYVGSYSSERAWFIDVAAGTHTLFTQANLSMFDSTFSWTQNFSVSEGGTTFIDLNCKTIDVDVSDVQVDRATVWANGFDAATITVVVMDWLENPISGSAVTIASTGGANNIVQPDSLTGVSGVTAGLIRSTEAGLKTISAKSDGELITKTANVTFLFDPFSVAVSELQVDKTTAVADGSEAVTVTVTVKDELGNPISGRSVRIESTGTNNIITQPLGLTGASGVAVGLLRSTKAELKTISARVNAAPVTQTRDVTFTTGELRAARSDAQAGSGR